MSATEPPATSTGTDSDRAEQVRAFLAALPDGDGALNRRMGIELVEVTSDRVVATMPVEGNTQPFGLLHGGASAVLAETVASVAAGLAAWPDGVAVGVDLNATHHRSARSGVVTGTATPAHVGRSSSAWEVVITDDRGRRVCTARLTCSVLPKERLGG
ncbi:hotdog fold thioesterase [Nocardioides sp. GY 10127]|uniref:PaaI family thioesterase n=1 Tax=Nocardioides sp. GY 10127 TaxID=2569762 RepID=UPI0010A7AB90|nr:hotdog fold thioesterase [Nocardioides sp. GY 10127]TIC81025.1 hotdog fold thioesterase [Nocardioides sp. GY 10127]